MSTINFKQYMYDAIETWIKEHPDAYVNPNYISSVLEGIGVSGFPGDTMDFSGGIYEWFGNMWGY